MFTYVQWFRFIQDVFIMLNVNFYTNKSFTILLSIFCNDELLSCLFEKSILETGTEGMCGKWGATF